MLKVPAEIGAYFIMYCTVLYCGTAGTFTNTVCVCFLPIHSGPDIVLQLQSSAELNDIVIEFRCVVAVSTPAVWLARENIKRLTPRPCINVESNTWIN